MSHVHQILFRLISNKVIVHVFGDLTVKRWRQHYIYFNRELELTTTMMTEAIIRVIIGNSPIYIALSLLEVLRYKMDSAQLWQYREFNKKKPNFLSFWNWFSHPLCSRCATNGKCTNRNNRTQLFRINDSLVEHCGFDNVYDGTMNLIKNNTSMKSILHWRVLVKKRDA